VMHASAPGLLARRLRAARVETSATRQHEAMRAELVTWTCLCAVVWTRERPWVQWHARDVG
jgi:hypothetical protein